MYIISVGKGVREEMFGMRIQETNVVNVWCITWEDEYPLVDVNLNICMSV